MRTILSKQQFFSLAVSVLLSVFMVAVVAYGATITISNVGIGSGSSTPGAAVGAKGAGLFEGFVHAAYFRSTSTSESSGFGTTSPGAEFAVSGAGLFEGFVHADYFTSTSTNTSWLLGGNFGLGTTTPGAKLDVRGSGLFDGTVSASSLVATSTTATSTLRYGMQIATTTTVDGQSGRWVIGSSTIPNADVANTGAIDPGLTISGVGSAGAATGSLYITGETGGGQIIIKSTDGTRCVSITATGGTGALDASPSTGLTLKVVACPR